MGAVDRPYRQRLYVLEPGSEPNQATSRVFELVEPEALVGLCRQKRPVHWNLDRVRELTGCAIALKLKDGRFRGATFGRFCEDKQRRAEYETSEVLLDQAALEKWDRGFDKDGQQVWGSTLGPYRFDRK